MKSIILLILFLFSSNIFAGTHFSAVLVKNKTYLSIHISDDHLIPPFEAGELWKILRSNEQIKTINEKELVLNCDGMTNQNNDTFGNCSLLFPYNLFKKVGNIMVFKAEGQVAARLNRYFVDSAYLSIERNEVYLSAYNTRGLFYFGIDEKLIQK